MKDKPILIIESGSDLVCGTNGEGKYVLEGIFATINDTYHDGSRFYMPENFKKREPKQPKTYDNLIEGREAIPNYERGCFRVENILSKIYTDDEYNREYIKWLEDAVLTIKDFKYGYIDDSSEILILSYEEGYNNYTMNGIFKP